MALLQRIAQVLVLLLCGSGEAETEKWWGLGRWTGEQCEMALALREDGDELTGTFRLTRSALAQGFVQGRRTDGGYEGALYADGGDAYLFEGRLEGGNLHLRVSRPADGAEGAWVLPRVPAFPPDG